MSIGLFYVYEHWRPDKGECFYVGKGRGRRAFQMRPRNAHHVAIQAKLERLNLTVEICLVGNDLSEELAFALEIERIMLWKSKGANLANRTAGGEGFSGGKLPPKAIARIRQVHTGKINSPETRAKISAAKKGHIVTRETREKISRSKKGSRQPEACRSGLLKANLGRSLSAETKEKISSKLLGRKLSAETIQRIRQAKACLSDKTRRRMSEGQKRRFARMRAT